MLALVLVPRYLATPFPLTATAAPIPAQASGPLVESDEALQSEPPPLVDLAPPSEPPVSDDGTESGILLARQCLALAERDPLAASAPPRRSAPSALAPVEGMET